MNTYVKVVDWDDFVHPDQRRKLQPPIGWIKLHTTTLELLGDLTPGEFGGFCRIVLLAAQSGNNTPNNFGFLRRRCGITRKVFKSLQNRGLISISNEKTEWKKSQENQQNSGKSACEDSADCGADASTEEIRGNETKGNERGNVSYKLTSVPPPRPPNSKSFDVLKEDLLDLSRKFASADRVYLHMLSNQSLGLSESQFNAAYDQLIEDRLI